MFSLMESEDAFPYIKNLDISAVQISLHSTIRYITLLFRNRRSNMGSYAASFLPSVLVPLSAIASFVAMGLFYLYIESDA